MKRYRLIQLQPSLLRLLMKLDLFHTLTPRLPLLQMTLYRLILLAQPDPTP